MTKYITKEEMWKIIKIILFSMIYTMGLHFFMNPSNLLTTGLAGVAQIIEKTTPFNYSTVYILINIPGIIIGFKYLGKKFTVYSIFNIFTVSVFSFLFSYVNIRQLLQIDPLIDAIFGGILMGYAVGKLLKMGASSGGTDFYAMYLLKYKNIDFEKVNLIINVLIIITGIFFFGIELGLYTLISLYIRNTALEQTFTNAQTVTLFIVGDDLQKVSSYINKKLKRGTTIIDNAYGGYTHHEKQIIMTTLNKYEYSIFIAEIFDVEPSLFINIMDTNQIVGNYKKDKGEV